MLARIKPTVMILVLFALSGVGHSQTLVIEGGLYPSWSPDGSEFVCWSEAGILRVALSGAPVDTIVRQTALEEVGWALWHPDGRHIIHLMRPYLTGIYHIVKHDLEGDLSQAWQVPNLWDDPGITLNPDGSELFFSDSVDQVWALDLTSGAVRFVLDGQCAEISPDGGWIAFATTASDDATIAVEPTLGGERVLLSGGFWPHWAPDSAHLVYTTPSIDLVLASRDGTTSQVLQSGSDWYLAGPISSDWKLAYTKCASEFGPCEIWTLDVTPPTPVEHISWGAAKRIYR